VTGRDDVRTSKLLSLVLRHQPEKVGLTLDPAGWVDVETLLAALRAHGRPVTRADLERIVATSDKQRFALDRAADRIRANQGHSVGVDLGLPVAEPPAVLYHGTPDRNLASIQRDGLRRGSRHDVHLSADVATARRVGARRGRAVVLAVDTAGMVAAGHEFRVSANGVWLVDAVPPAYLRVVDEPEPGNGD
jgi:putative RNA 2'-phosphotransferase